MKQILTEIVDRLSELAASLDALEAELVSNGGLTKDGIGNRFHTHKQTVEGHLVPLRLAISRLPE
jgi:hypothetical protein